MVICLERGADLHMAQLMPLPLTVSCFSKLQIGFTFLVPAHPGSPGKGPLNGCVLNGCVYYFMRRIHTLSLSLFQLMIYWRAKAPRRSYLYGLGEVVESGV